MEAGFLHEIEDSPKEEDNLKKEGNRKKGMTKYVGNPEKENDTKHFLQINMTQNILLSSASISTSTPT